MVVTGSCDWLEIVGPTNRVSRNMSDPTHGPLLAGLTSPDRYFSPYSYTGTLDAGGVHVNSTVLTHGLYLAVEGGSFNSYNITGIGFDKMEQILYRAETLYFDSTENFFTAYDDIIQAANDLYGPTDVAELTKALNAVEMNGIPVPERSGLALAAFGLAFCLAAYRRKCRVS